MKIHEYQGKEILRKFGVTVPRGIPCMSVDEAVKAAETLGGPVWVVKAQIHACGRGMDIEEVAEKHPELIHKVAIDPALGLTDADADSIAAKIGIPQASIADAR